MTSGNLSFSEKLKNQKKYITRTLWTALVALPFVAGYFIFGVILLVSRCINYAAMYGQSDVVLKVEKCKAVSLVMGINSVTFGLVTLVAIAFAFQGFSYVFNQSQMDFYLSQPTTRFQRIKKNYVNAFVTFLIIFGSVELIAFLIAIGMGAVNNAVLFSVLIEFLRSVVLFLTVYNVTVLAIMLSGTMLSAFLLTGFFAIVSVAISAEIRGLKEIFFKTFSYSEGFSAILSPLYDRFYALYNTNLNYDDEFNAKMVFELAKDNLRLDIDTFIVGIIAFIFVIIFSKKRKAEMAGKSFVFRPFRWCIKVIVSIMAGVAAGILVYMMNDYVWNDKLFIMMCVIMLLATALTGCFIEVILDANIRRFTKGKASTIISVCMVLLVFVVLRGDLIGFDSYVPAPEKVESCAILEDDYNFNVWIGRGMFGDGYCEKHMYITDVDSFIKLASIGMDGRKNYDTDSYYSKGYELSILYRMKDGRKIYRCIFVPYDTDETLMDSIISSEEYKKGHYICFDDDAIREMTGSNVGNNSVSYVSAGGRKSDDTITYVEISDAYRKDILEGANYSYLKKNQPIGSLEFTSNGTHYVNVTVPVYEKSTNLLKLIKDHNIYVEPKLTPEMISSIRVDNYYPGYNLDDFDSGKLLRDEEVMTTSATYDPVKNSKEVSEILQDIVTSDYNGNWYDYSQKDNKYSVVITKKSDGSDYYGSDGSYYSFLKGKVPEFVVKDTE